MESLTLYFGQNRNSITIDEYGKRYDRIFGKKKPDDSLSKAFKSITQKQKTIAFELLQNLKLPNDDFQRIRRTIVDASEHYGDSLIAYLRNQKPEKSDE